MVFIMHMYVIVAAVHLILPCNIILYIYFGTLQITHLSKNRNARTGV